MRHPGWDTFTPKPGKEKEMVCRVCKAKMNVERNVDGPTGWAEAKSGSSHLHDLFVCPDVDENWHDQAFALMQFIKYTPSGTLAMLVERELRSVLKNKKATKQNFSRPV